MNQTPDVELALRPTAESGREARRAVDRFRPSFPEHIVDVLHLLVTELVSNAVRHSGASPSEVFLLRMWLRPDGVRVELHDNGPGFDPEALLPRSPDSGWGLSLLESLASRWGVAREDGARVWFEIDHPAHEADLSRLRHG
ncbi:MAG TPA: ATP-binding protein [Actinomycetota bacterium]|nr:ATP-binding protein [Actinomycetota bacterium]